jgi:hypothetical protein
MDIYGLEIFLDSLVHTNTADDIVILIFRYNQGDWSTIVGNLLGWGVILLPVTKPPPQRMNRCTLLFNWGVPGIRGPLNNTSKTLIYYSS